MVFFGARRGAELEEKVAGLQKLLKSLDRQLAKTEAVLSQKVSREFLDTSISDLRREAAEHNVLDRMGRLEAELGTLAASMERKVGREELAAETSGLHASLNQRMSAANFDRTIAGLDSSIRLLTSSVAAAQLDTTRCLASLGTKVGQEQFSDALFQLSSVEDALAAEQTSRATLSSTLDCVVEQAQLSTEGIAALQDSLSQRNERDHMTSLDVAQDRAVLSGSLCWTPLPSGPVALPFPGAMAGTLALPDVIPRELGCEVVVSVSSAGCVAHRSRCLDLWTIRTSGTEGGAAGVTNLRRLRVGGEGSSELLELAVNGSFGREICFDWLEAETSAAGDESGLGAELLVLGYRHPSLFSPQSRL